MVTYTLIDGLDTFSSGVGNIDPNPLFVDADGPDNIVGTMDDNLRLSEPSPSINAGDNDAVPPSITTDLDGESRFSGVSVDMGPYEFQTEPSGNGDPSCLDPTPCDDRPDHIQHPL